MCPPQCKQVITMCDSRCCWTRTRQLMPGWMYFLQCLHIWCLSSGGILTFVVIEMCLAMCT
jgi:hypothetical protein